MKGFKPVIKMASGGLVPKVAAPGKAGAKMGSATPKPKKMPGLPKLPKLPSPMGGGSKMPAMKKGGHVDEAADIALIKKVVKPTSLKSDKRFGK